MGCMKGWYLFKQCRRSSDPVFIDNYAIYSVQVMLELVVVLYGRGNMLLCFGIPNSMVSLNLFIAVSLNVPTLTLSQVTDCTFCKDASTCATRYLLSNMMEYGIGCC